MEKRTKLPRANNAFRVPTESEMDFFKWWCIFLKPFVGLTEREIDVVASFLKQRFELSKSVTDPAALDLLLMTDSVKRKIAEECNITVQHLYVVLSVLRKKKIVVNNALDSRLIPNIRPDDNGIFQLLLLFNAKSLSYGV